MAYAIKFLSLQKAELEYEVELRGGTGESVQDLRKQIVKLASQLPSEDILESHLDPGDDLKCVHDSLLKSQSNLKNLKIKFDKNHFSRTETLLHHIYHRINRITSISEVADTYKVCLSNFQSQYKELSALRPSTSQIKASTSSSTECAVEANAITVTCERNLSSEISKVKFTGNTCVRSFILKVEEYVLSRGISYDKILALGFEIFEGDALHWYRYNKHKIQSWSDLRQLLMKDFTASDHDYRLAADIHSRTQGVHENITIYLAIMHGMFSGLSKPLSESEKLDILIHNIRPCYAGVLAASPNIDSIETLQAVCRNYEDIQSRFSHFHEPPKETSSTFASQFVYKGPSSSNGYSYKTNNQQFKNNYTNQKYNTYQGNTQQSKNTFTNSKYMNDSGSLNDSRNSNAGGYNRNKTIPIAAVSKSSGTPQFCPRCRSDTHSLANCTQERFLVCFKCGKKDVRFPECPDCNPVGNQASTKN